MICKAVYTSPLGDIAIAAGEKGIKAVWFDTQKPYIPAKNEIIREDASFFRIREAFAWLDAYFAQQRPVPADLALDLEGSDFQKLIWSMLCEIPCGQLTSYGALSKEAAKLLGHAMSAQAVGGAVGSNPAALIVPCHRVIGAKNCLVGYGGGLRLKTELLRFEGIDTDRLTLPKQKGEKPLCAKQKL